MLACKDLVAHLQDQIVRPLLETLLRAVGNGRGLLQYRVSGDHFPRNEILPDTEVLQRSLGLCTPKPVGGNLDLAQAIGFDTHVHHDANSLEESCRSQPARPLSRTEIGGVDYRNVRYAHHLQVVNGDSSGSEGCMQ